MQAVVHNLLVEVPRAAAVWSALLAVGVTALIAMFTGFGARRTGRPADTPVVPAPPARPTRGELARFADEVAVAAGRATVTYERLRTRWLAAQDRTAAAWRGYEDAEAAVQRLADAAALPLPRTPRTPAEYADRERYLRRAATAAFWRGDLSVLELSDILAYRDGWDPRRHPVAQELELARAIRASRLAGYRAATVRERESWAAAESAAVAARSLRAEADAAVARVHAAPAPLPIPGLRPANLPHPAIHWRPAAAVG